MWRRRRSSHGMDWLPPPESESCDQGSSNDESSSLTDEVCHTTFRAAFPSLRPLPLETEYRRLPESIMAHKMTILNGANKIMDKYGLLNSDSEVEMVYRRSRDDPGSAAPTLLIITAWNDDSNSTWPRAVREMVDFIDETFRGSDFPEDFDIEMIAPERIMDKYLYPVETIPALLSKWSTIKSIVRSRLEACEATSSRFTTIALFRLGYSPESSLNPITIYIAVDIESDETEWPGVIAEIQRALPHDWRHLHVHIEHDASDRQFFTLREPRGEREALLKRGRDFNLLIQGPYEQRVNLGESISASCYPETDLQTTCNPAIGTLGCYVEIKSKRNPKWVRYGLTNYHVVRSCINGFAVNLEMQEHSLKYSTAPPREGSDLWAVDHGGFYPGRNMTLKPIESPARAKHNNTIWTLNGQIKDVTRAGGEARKRQLEQERDSKVSFFDDNKHNFGTVEAASGFYRRSPQRNHRMDWALIKIIDDRQGKNILPVADVWRQKYPGDELASPSEATYGSLLGNPGSSIKFLNFKDRVYKFGTTTRATYGVYSEYKVDCNLSDDKHMNMGVSEEFVFVGSDPFTAPGDSGAVVFDNMGRAIGLAFRGSRPGQVGGAYSYVTPIEDVFNDIKNFSKGQITDIRIAID